MTRTLKILIEASGDIKEIATWYKAISSFLQFGLSLNSMMDLQRLWLIRREGSILQKG